MRIAASSATAGIARIELPAPDIELLTAHRGGAASLLAHACRAGRRRARAGRTPAKPRRRRQADRQGSRRQGDGKPTKAAAKPAPQGRRHGRRRPSAKSQAAARDRDNRRRAGAASSTAGADAGRRAATAAAAPLAVAPTLATVRRRSRRRQAGDRARAQGQAGAGDRRRRRRSAIRSRASWSNGRSCAATTTAPTSPATPPSSPPIRAGRASVTLRRRAEAMLWQERPDPATVRAFFAQGPAAHRQGPVRARPRAARAGRPRRRAGLVREAWRNDTFSRELESQALDVFGDLLTRADHKARMDRRLYAEDADGGLRAANRAGGTRAGDRQGAHRGDQEGRQRQGAARRRAGRRAPRRRLHLQPRPVAAPHRQDRRSRRADAVGAARSGQAARPRRMVDRAPADRPQAARHRRRQDRLSGRARRRAAGQGELPRRARVHRRLDRAALPQRSGDRARRTSPRSPQGTDNPISLARADYWQGRAAEALGRKQRGARALPGGGALLRPPITARSRAPGSASANSRCAAPPALPPTRAALRLEVVRAVELLYAIDERDLVVPLAGRSRRQARPTSARWRRSASSPRSNDDARAMLLLGKAALGRGLPLDHLRLPDHRHAATITPIGPAVEPARRLFDRAPGKHVQSAHRLERQRAWA